MVAVTLQESGTGARAKVRVLHENHQIEARKGNMHWTGTGKDIGIEIELMILKVREGSGSGNGNARRVEAKRGMTLTGVEAEKERETETGIGEDDQSELFLWVGFWEFRWNVLEWRDAHVVGPGWLPWKRFCFHSYERRNFFPFLV